MAFNQARISLGGYVRSSGEGVSVDSINQILAGVTQLSLRGSTNLAGVCVDANGNLYLTDAIKNIILKIGNSGVISVIAGASGVSGNNGSTTVTAANARFNYPTGICCDRNGDLYVCDTKNNQIRKISNNKVSLVAGAASTATGTANGVGSAARFNNPYDIDTDKSGNLYVADTYNHSIRKIVGGTVTTMAGLSGTTGNVPVWANMTTAYGVYGTVARFSFPYGVACHPNGYIFVSDTGNHVIKRIDPAGNVRIFSGSGTYGGSLGTAKTCQYKDLKFSDVDPSGNLYIVDYADDSASRLVRVNGEGVPGNVINFATSLITESNYLAAVACTASGKLMVVQSEYMIEEYSSSSSSSSQSSSSSSSSIDSSSSSSSIDSSSSSSSIDSSSSSSSLSSSSSSSMSSSSSSIDSSSSSSIDSSSSSSSSSS